MTDKIYDGGPAFPRPYSKDEARSEMEYAEPGMTLRDYFAAKAMGSFIVTSAMYHLDSEDGESGTTGSLVRDSYKIADAMLAARKGPTQ